jgi:hypothetical protein
MALRPIGKMLEAVEAARTDSDVSLFFELMYLGELLTKTVAVGLVAAIVDHGHDHGSPDGGGCWVEVGPWSLRSGASRSRQGPG